MLPAGSPAPRRVTGQARIIPAPGWVDFVVPTGARPAFFVEEDSHDLVLTLYDTQFSTDLIHYGENDSLVRAAQWTPDRERPRAFHAASRAGAVRLPRDVGQGPRILVLRVRRPPAVDPHAPLKGMLIAVDPGHPPIGATGPTGLYEPVPTLAIGFEVKRMLEAEGATVYMTRTTADPVALNDRPTMIRRSNANAAVSIHLNALPDGVNPFISNGTGAYYFWPQSIPLARELQTGMVSRMGLRNLGINYDNLALARPTWMPAVLCEGAFLMLPEQESGAAHAGVPARIRARRGGRPGAVFPLARVREMRRGRAPFAALCSLVLLCGAGRAAAQGVPPDGNWRTITTAHFRVHFLPQVEGPARRAAAQAEIAYAKLAKHLHTPRGVVDLVIADNVDFSNGFTTVFPTNRITIYALPGLDDPSLEFYDSWFEQITTHELTHTFQLDRTAGWWAIGQDVLGRAPLLFPNTYEPAWMTEGLAVYYESALTDAGRVNGTISSMVVRSTAQQNALPYYDRWSLATTVYPYGNISYDYGAEFLDYLATMHGEPSLGDLVERASRRPIPVHLQWRRERRVRHLVRQRVAAVARFARARGARPSARGRANAGLARSHAHRLRRAAPPLGGRQHAPVRRQSRQELHRGVRARHVRRRAQRRAPQQLRHAGADVQRRDFVCAARVHRSIPRAIRSLHGAGRQEDQAHARCAARAARRARRRRDRGGAIRTRDHHARTRERRRARDHAAHRHRGRHRVGRAALVAERHRSSPLRAGRAAPTPTSW